MSEKKWNCMESAKAFLGLTLEDAVGFDQAKAVVIPFGLEASVSYGGGTAKGPQAMIHASHEVELFDEQLWCESFREIGVVTLQEQKIKESLPEALNQLEETVSAVLDAGKFPFTFGGEHSITAGAIRPFVKRYPDITLLHFDAHADLRDGYEGEHYSHASAIRRCLDFDNVSTVSIGIRNISAGEIPFLEANRHRIHVYWAKDKKQWDIAEMIAHLKGRSVYVTVDVDGFDASLMPATGTPEPGGLFWQDVMEILTEAARHCQFVGADINELAPVGHLHACDFLAAKLAYKILGLTFLKAKL